jgi:hypothetical protein
MAKKGEVTVRLLEKFLMPMVATAASAAASYAAKKAPQLLEGPISKVKDAPLGAPVEKVKEATGSNGRRQLSADEFGRRREQRAQSRADRRKAVR